MQARFEGREVPLEHLELDDLGWDHAGSLGTHVLELTLSERDLLGLGGALVNKAREFEAEEPGYFDDLDGVVVPESDALFVNDPMRLEEFLRAGSFWSRETAVALFELMDASRTSAAPQWLVQCLRGLGKRGDGVVLQLGVAPAPTG